jgi:hypothetical protein
MSAQQLRTPYRIDSTVGAPPFSLQRVFTALDSVRTVRDPGLSPDGQWVVFSMLNPDFHNRTSDVRASSR